MSDIANDEKNGSVSAAWAAPKRHKLAVRIMPRTPPCVFASLIEQQPL